jgi:hypothetical protein
MTQSDSDQLWQFVVDNPWPTATMVVAAFALIGFMFWLMFK